MRCRHCFAGFTDAGHENLPRIDTLEVVRELARGFARITFVGGEPTLCPWLLSALAVARVEGLGTSVVTNAWRLVHDADYRDQLLGAVDWIGLSVDSGEAATNHVIGR